MAAALTLTLVSTVLAQGGVPGAQRLSKADI